MSYVTAPSGIYVLQLYRTFAGSFEIYRAPVVAFKISEETNATTPVPFSSDGDVFDPDNEGLLFPDGRVFFSRSVYETTEQWAEAVIAQRTSSGVY